MGADLPSMTLEQTQAYYEQKPSMSRSANGDDAINPTAQNAKIEALIDAGLSVGVKAGLRMQLQNINRAVEGSKRELDTIYDFGPLMIRDRVVPPVITEARDLYNQDGAYALRLSGAFYKIESQARFSSTPPNWRDYLWFGSGKTSDDDAADFLRPKNDHERQVFRNAIAKGWHQGVEQANVMLQYAMDRLNRDVLGMLRFHTFVINRKITMPAVASQSWGYSKQGDGSIAVDETLLRITTLPEFNSNLNQWKAQAKTAEMTPPLQAQPTKAMNRIEPKFDPAADQEREREAGREAERRNQRMTGEGYSG